VVWYFEPPKIPQNSKPQWYSPGSLVEKRSHFKKEWRLLASGKKCLEPEIYIYIYIYISITLKKVEFQWDDEPIFPMEKWGE